MHEVALREKRRPSRDARADGKGANYEARVETTFCQSPKRTPGQHVVGTVVGRPSGNDVSFPSR